MKWLIYSELARSRKSAVLSVIFAVLAVGIFVLIALSFNYGNLGKLPIEAKESFFDMNNSVSVPLIAIISGFIIDAAIDGSREANLCYRLFRRSTPISPLKYSAVNVIMMSIYLVIGLGLAFGLSAVVLAVSGLAFTAEHAAAIFACSLIILHDALEHIPEKERLMLHLKSFLKADGLLYLGFPAWQMPFGGHQQMAKNRIIANCPYIHLLPRSLFRFVFRACGEKESTVKCFFEIRDTRITIEGFHKLVTATGLRIVNQRLYFINPNYQVKFGLKPRILSPVIGKIPYVRNFFTTTCYYLLAKQEEAN